MNYEGVGTCRCCLLVGPFNDIWSQQICEGEPEIYGDMLEECFCISIKPVQNLQDQICNLCITRLRDALQFKRLVLSSEKDMIDYLANTSPQNDEFEEIEYLEDDVWNDPGKKKDNNVNNLRNETVIKFGLQSPADIQLEDSESKQDEILEFHADEIVGCEEVVIVEVADNEIVDMHKDIKCEIEQEGALEYSADGCGQEYNKTTNSVSHLSPASKVDRSGVTSNTSKSSAKNQRYTEAQLQDCLSTIKTGHLNQHQAALIYNIPRQTIGLRLKRELGANYKSIISKWKTTQLHKNYKQMMKLNYRTTKENCIQKCMDAIKQGDVSLHSACRLYKVSVATVKSAFKKEYGDNYKETLLSLRRKYYKYKRERIENEGRIESDNARRAARVRRARSKKSRRRPQPSKQVIVEAVTAIKEERISIYAAATLFNISYKTLDRIVNSNIDVVNSDLATILQRKRHKDYSTETLHKCVELVRKGVLTQKKAARMYDVPQNAIYLTMKYEGVDNDTSLEKPKEKLKLCVDKNGADAEQYIGREVYNDEQQLKFETDIKHIFTYTNATPFEIAEGKLKCAYCPFVTADPEELRFHTGTIHRDDRLTNTQALVEPANIKEILRLDIEDLQCIECSKYIEKWDHLFVHLQLHDVAVNDHSRIVPYLLNRDLYLCPLCNESFESLHCLDTHMNGHYKNYVCQECGDTFASLQRLRLHKYMKGGEIEKFTCVVCYKVFDSKSNFRQHLEQLHKPNLRVRCMQCNEPFNNFYSRHLHMLEKHKEKLPSLPCKVCGKVFFWKPLYTAHYKRMHVDYKATKSK